MESVVGVAAWMSLKFHLLFSRLSVRLKQLLLMLIDFALLTIAGCAALWLRLGDLSGGVERFWQAFALVPFVAIPIMARCGMYRAVIRYFDYNTLWVTVKSLTLSLLVWALVVATLQLATPRSFIFLLWLTAVPMIAGSRFVARWVLRQASPFGFSQKRANARRVIVYGAGSAGQQLINAISQSAELQVVGICDDDKDVIGRVIAGLRIFDPQSLVAKSEQLQAEDILLAIPSLGKRRRKQLLASLAQLGLRVKTLPSVDQLAGGAIEISTIRNVNVADLLGRHEVQAVEKLLDSCVRGQVVLVTGAGGSIGSELCRQVVKRGPAMLVLLDSSEFGLYQIDQELAQSEEAAHIPRVAILGNVQDREHMERLMRRYRVESVYHAAAYKHVPIVEHNIVAGLTNNVFGTLAVAEAAVQSGVKNFVLVSTDKAVRPTNVMGASKRIAEMVLQGMAESQSDNGQTRFAIVRFGNVLGSSGSVVPLFERQIAEGGPVTVTDPDMTRYFMTIPEAASLVLQAGAMGSSGDVFVLDMGEPVRIADMARQMVYLAGKTVKGEGEDSDGEIAIEYTGLRPGEKLYEELLIGEAVSETSHPMIMMASERHWDWDAMQAILVEVQALIKTNELEALRALLMKAVVDYQPQCGLVDHLGSVAETVTDIAL